MQNGKPLKSPHGFTMIEIMIVMAMVAILITLAAPRYIDGLARSKEVALKQNLKEMRDAIDQYHADKGRYPASLTALVDEKYLRFIPLDPATERDDTWQPSYQMGDERGVYDVHSGASQRSRQGASYSEW